MKAIFGVVPFIQEQRGGGWGRLGAPQRPLWFSGSFRSRLSAPRPGSAQVPGKRERARWVPARLRAQGCSAHHSLARVCLGSPAPVPGPQGAGLQQPVRSATRIVHAPAAVPEPGTSRKPQGTSHGARARGNVADTVWQCHREPTVTAPRLTVAAPR